MSKGIKSNIMVSGFSFMNGNGENYGMAIVKLDPWDQRKTPELQLEAIQTEVQKRANEISAARIICFTPPAIMGLGVTGGATFMLSGDGEVNPAELSTTARKFALDLSALPETLYAMSTYNAVLRSFIWTSTARRRRRWEFRRGPFIPRFKASSLVLYQ